MLKTDHKSLFGCRSLSGRSLRRQSSTIRTGCASNQRPSGSGRQVPRRVVSLARSAMIVPSAISKPFLPSSGQFQTCGDSECAKDDACNEMQNPLQPAARVYRWSAGNAPSEKHVGCPRAFNDVFATLARCRDRLPRERLQPISCGR
jgi:hypothetical protein